MKKLAYIFLTTSLLFSSCSSEDKKEKKEDKKEVKVEEGTDCTYSIDASAVTVNFVAYKFENKTGVKGQFQEITINGGKASANPLEVIEGATFSIPVLSVFTSDPARDQKIRESFFGTLVNTAEITGSVKSIEGDKVVLSVTLNEITFDIDAVQSFNDTSLTLEAEMDVSNWNGQAAIAALHKVCEANHANPDGGKSILWPNVSIKIQGVLKKECK